MKRARGRLGRAQAGGRPASERKRKTRLQGGSARHCRGLWATGNPRVQGPTMQTRGVRLRLSKECRRCNAAGKYSNISEESTPQTSRARGNAPFPARLGAGHLERRFATRARTSPAWLPLSAGRFLPTHRRTSAQGLSRAGVGAAPHPARRRRLNVPPLFTRE